MIRLFGRTHDSSEIPSISVRELKRRMERGEEVVSVDVRQPHGYDDHPGTIPGAVRIPPTVLPEHYGELPQNRPIVLFCT